ncbi:MAG: HEAT repeat domain-containing protein [Planctomycetes bacterium]|nr:HEAT repeat domain-containing protein [Planctomycetota bacterium]MCC7170887.1 HEAT repeat domain-containing protein [Planctomycetota bacterium]
MSFWNYVYPTVVAVVVASSPASAEVVHLRDGSTLIGTVVDSDPAVDLVVRTSTRDVDVPRDDVVLLESRASLQKSFDALRKSVDVDREPATAVPLIAWALRKGLDDEAIELADRALSAAATLDPKVDVELPPEFLELPIAGVRSIDVLDDTSAWRLLSLAGGKKPATALLANARLRDVILRSDVTPILLRGLLDVTPKIRTTSLELLAFTTPDGTIEPVIERMLFDRDADVRKVAMAAVKAYEEDGVIYPLVRALRQDDPRLRTAALDALEELRDPRAIGSLIHMLKRASTNAGVTRNNVAFTKQVSIVSDFDTEIAQASVIAQPIVSILQEGIVLDVAVAGVSGRGISVAERAHVVRVLSMLTGQDFGDDVTRWEAWSQGAPAK